MSSEMKELSGLRHASAGPCEGIVTELTNALKKAEEALMHVSATDAVLLALKDIRAAIIKVKGKRP